MVSIRARPATVHTVHRTMGHRRGAITRLASPGDLGQILKPFLYVDRFDSRAGPLTPLPWTPLSGLASLTYVFEGAVDFEDSQGGAGRVCAGGAVWLRAGRAAWHAAAPSVAGPTRGFRLRLALPPHLELGPSQSLYRRAEQIPAAGPAQVLLGQYAGAAGPIPPPASMICLAVRLAAGEVWCYAPSRGHRVLWLAVSRGALGGAVAADEGELLVLAASATPFEIRAETDAEFLIGSAFPHPYGLVLGRHAAHTSEGTLAAGEAEIARQRRAFAARGVMA